jgi:chromate transport protein ChrA
MFLEIFLVFSRISLVSFGGIFGMIPEIERILVVEKNWMTSEEFLQIYSLGQFLPGPNMSMCPLIGFKVYGWSGFLAGALGIYLVPIVFLGIVWNLYRRFRDLLLVQRIEHSLRPLVLGLILSSCIRVFWLGSTGIDHSHSWEKLFFGIMAVVFGVFILKLISQKKGVDSFNSIFVFGALWLGLHLAFDFFKAL